MKLIPKMIRAFHKSPIDSVEDPLINKVSNVNFDMAVFQTILDRLYVSTRPMRTTHDS